MFHRTSLSLLLSNAAVFSIVLSIFSAAVYFSVMKDFEKEQERRVNIFTDTVVGSFESAEGKDPENFIPEILETDKRDFLPKNASAQWFDTSGKLLAEKGPLKITKKFFEKGSLQYQDSPHALLLTRPVWRAQKLIGYLRAGISLSKFDNYRRHFITSLIFGTVLALVSAFVGALWLVKQSLRPLEETMDKLTQFTSDVSHELRNPLMAVKTNAVVALRHSEGMRANDKEKFDIIVNATNQMIKTTTDLLRLAHTGQNTVYVCPANVSIIIEQTVAAMSSMADSKSITIETSVPERLAVGVGDEDMKRILGNVLENAIQYTEPHGKIAITAQKQGKRVRIEVADTGIGIAKDELPRVFDRFWRSNKARSHRTGGNGLGLAIVQATTERYGGNVAVSSQLAKGTNVIITVPSETGH